MRMREPNTEQKGALDDLHDRAIAMILRHGKRDSRAANTAYKASLVWRFGDIQMRYIWGSATLIIRKLTSNNVINGKIIQCFGLSYQGSCGTHDEWSPHDVPRILTRLKSFMVLDDLANI